MKTKALTLDRPASLDATITCPKCGAEVPLSEGVSHRIREQLAGELEARRKELDEALSAREKKLRKCEEALEKQRTSLDNEIEARLAARRKELLADAARQAEEKLGAEMKDLEERLQEQSKKLGAARQAELKLRKQQRELEEAKESLELEVARKLDEERGKIRDGAMKAAAEAERLKLAEKEKLISDLQKEIERLKQKAAQGPVQTQGEGLELDLEARLVATYPADEVEPVAKGQRGADLLQRVRTSHGHACGTILWETKRARNWGDNWIAKLKDDQRAARADIAVLVSQCLPENISGFGQVDGVWVCDYPTMVSLAAALRHGLILAAVARQAEVGRQGKMEQLYRYLTSVEFRQRVEGIVEAFKTMRDDLESEKRALQKHWARREKQLEKAVCHTAGLYGGVQGIVGQDSLPDIAPLQLEQSE